jgi:hypothetical protein
LPKNSIFPNIKEEFNLDNINSSQESTNSYSKFTLKPAIIKTNLLEQLWASKLMVPLNLDLFVAWLYKKPDTYAIGKVLEYDEQFATVESYISTEGVFSVDSNIMQPVTILREDIIVGDFQLTIQNKLKKATLKVIDKYFLFFQDEVFLFHFF